jgi:hypothetical protein
MGISSPLIRQTRQEEPYPGDEKGRGYGGYGGYVSYLRGAKWRFLIIGYGG